MDSPYLTSARRSPVAVATMLMLSVTACSESMTSSGGHVVAISIDPIALALTTGATSALSAILFDDSGARLPGADVHWSVENPQIATVNAQGIVTALNAGETQVAASKGGRSAIAPISVTSLPPALVRVTPTAASVFAGSTTQLSAEVRDAGGGVVPGLRTTWSSGTASVASVNANGVVTGVRPGSAVITARAAGLTGTAVVTVRLVPVASVRVTPTSGTVAVNQTMQLTASLADAAGNILTGRTVSWTSANQATATVSAAGLVRGRARGTTTITTTSEGKTATATITVP